ncbi:unnamed protein product, partial [marine sediment metagenome]
NIIYRHKLDQIQEKLLVALVAIQELKERIKNEKSK